MNMYAYICNEFHYHLSTHITYIMCIVGLSASHTGLTTMLRPSCDLKMLESWEIVD